MSDKNFLTAIVYTLVENERGFVNHPKDPGGATKYGITISTLARWRGQPVTVDDVRALSPAEAIEIFHAWYWLESGCDKLSQPLITCLIFDVAVLFGPGVAALFAQKAAMDCGYPIAVDGQIGPESMAALNAVDPRAFAGRFHHGLKQRISALVTKRPASHVFRDGWQNRIDRYLTLAI